eukprot:scaffold3587_cov364-Prasinococcus_capsulatus_cf.AAC.11
MVYANAREHLKSVGVNSPAYKTLLVELLAQVIDCFLSQLKLPVLGTAVAATPSRRPLATGRANGIDLHLVSLQSYAKLKEPALKVRCRECDLALVTEAVESAKQLFVKLHPQEKVCEPIRAAPVRGDAR